MGTTNGEPATRETERSEGPHKTRPERKNSAERKCLEQLVSKGWRCTTRGWPDVAAWKDGRMVLVEVRSKRTRRLKRDQKRVLYSLAKHGVECYLYDVETGFEKLGPQSPHLD